MGVVWGGFEPTGFDNGFAWPGAPLALRLEAALGQLSFAFLQSAFNPDAFAATGWVDITADVQLFPGDTVTWSRGIFTNAPQDHVAGTGLLMFALNNGPTNSAGLLGYYTPNHVNCRVGFMFGIPVRIVSTYLGTTQTLWVGKIRGILPDAGQYGPKRVHVTAQDCMGDLVDAEVLSIPPQLAQTEVQLLQAIMAALPANAQPLGTSYDAALDLYTYALDDISGGVKALAVQSDVVLSAQGWLYPKANGVLRYENRQAITAKDSDFAFDNTMIALTVPSDLSNVFNRVRITVHPKTKDATASTVLWSQSGIATPIAAGQSVTIWGDYFDPANTLKLIGGTAFVTPVATTDYLGNAAADGSGANLTGNLTVTATAFASSVKYVVTASVDLFLTKLQIRGEGIYDNAPQTVESFTDRQYGDRPLAIDLRYQDNSSIAQDMADYINALYNLLAGQPQSLTFHATTADGLLDQALTREIGDVVTLSEEMTGLANVKAVIRGIAFSVRTEQAIDVTWALSPILTGSAFRLDDAERGVLDSVLSTLGYA